MVGLFLRKHQKEAKNKPNAWIRPKTNVTGILSVVSTLKCTVFLFFFYTTQRTLHECNGFEDVFKDGSSICVFPPNFLRNF